MITAARSLRKSNFAFLVKSCLWLDVACWMSVAALPTLPLTCNRTFPALPIPESIFVDSMVAEAQRSHPELDLRNENLLDVSFHRSFDVVTANGTFYLLGDQAWSMMRKMIERMFSLVTSALAFNSLSSWASNRSPVSFMPNRLESCSFAANSRLGLCCAMTTTRAISLSICIRPYRT